MTSNSLQFEEAYWLAVTLSGAVQVAAAHWPNKWTLNPAVCSYNRPPYAQFTIDVLTDDQLFLEMIL